MSERISPSDVADVGATTEPAESAGHQERRDDGATSSTTSNPLGPLLTTETPNGVTPDSVQREYGVSKGIALVLFGVIQMSGKDGMPALGNLLLGAVLEAKGRDLGGDDGDADHADDGGIETV